MKRFLFAAMVIFGVCSAAPEEALVNPGFEDGVLTPWTTNNWTLASNDPHSGSYCAFDEGNYWIMQEFTPIDVDDIVSVSIWYMQPESAIFAFDLFYGPSDYDEEIIYVADSAWVHYDMTYLLRPSGNLQAMRIWGYTGGGGDPDYSYLDDASIIYDEQVALEHTTFGSIKAMFAQ